MATTLPYYEQKDIENIKTQADNFVANLKNIIA